MAFKSEVYNKPLYVNVSELKNGVFEISFGVSINQETAKKMSYEPTNKVSVIGVNKTQIQALLNTLEKFNNNQMKKGNSYPNTVVKKLLDNWVNDYGNTEEELDELVDYDGSVLGGKTPLGYMNNKTVSSKKTTDAVVPATRQGGEQGRGYFYKRYWGESVERVGEEDMTKVLGMDSDGDDIIDTDTMSKNEIKSRYKKQYGFDDNEAEDRTETSGAIKGRKKRLFEDDEVMKMMEIILKSKDSDKEISEKNEVSDEIFEKKLKSLKKYADRQGIPLKSIIEKLKDYE